MKISFLLQCCLLILMLQLISTMADRTSHNGTIHQLPQHPSQELQETNEITEAERVLSNSHKIGGHGMGPRSAGGKAIGGGAAQTARRKHHHHHSNAPPPISTLKPLAVDAILISLLIL